VQSFKAVDSWLLTENSWLWQRTEMQRIVTLKQALDSIWQDAEPRIAAASATLREMNDDAILEMAKVFLLAKYGSQLLIDNKIERRSLYLKLSQVGASTLAQLGPISSPNAILQLRDIGRSVVACEDSFKQSWGKVIDCDACMILAAQQFARDHTDTILVEPAHLRKSRLEQAAETFGASPDLLLKMAELVRPLGPASIPADRR
jgi:hypothetical protein